MADQGNRDNARGPPGQHAKRWADVRHRPSDHRSISSNDRDPLMLQLRSPRASPAGYGEFPATTDSRRRRETWSVTHRGRI